jgi:hypothetical protein
MSSSNHLGSQRSPEIALSCAQRKLVEAAAQRCGVEAREWVGQALVHFDRWQNMWDGPICRDKDSEGEVELFATLVDSAPECLRGQWRLLHDVVRMNDALWVWPRQSVGEFEDGIEPTLPYIDRAALAEVWPRLRTLVAGFASGGTASPPFELVA